MRTTARFCLLGVPEQIQLKQQLNSYAIPQIGFGRLFLLLNGSLWLIKNEKLSNFMGGGGGELLYFIETRFLLQVIF